MPTQVIGEMVEQAVALGIGDNAVRTRIRPCRLILRSTKRGSAARVFFVLTAPEDRLAGLLTSFEIPVDFPFGNLRILPMVEFSPLVLTAMENP